MKKKIAVIGAVLDNPIKCQAEFNQLISNYKSIIKGRMGIPFENANVSVVSLVVSGTLDEINSLTGKLGNISCVNIKTALSKKEIDL